MPHYIITRRTESRTMLFPSILHQYIKVTTESVFGTVTYRMMVDGSGSGQCLNQQLFTDDQRHPATENISPGCTVQCLLGLIQITNLIYYYHSVTLARPLGQGPGALTVQPRITAEESTGLTFPSHVVHLLSAFDGRINYLAAAT